ncbi:MAG: hypothetical protein LBU89_11330 [Fibromonadaceae bacterium]|jgi:hypothetical protein|nr:hypothetical protein [Fibromonadaceae bacterium]
MAKFESLDPDNIPGIDYYLEVFNEPNSGYPKCSNHSHELTTKGFVTAANAWAEPFSEALKQSRKYDRAN